MQNQNRKNNHTRKTVFVVEAFSLQPPSTGKVKKRVSLRKYRYYKGDIKPSPNTSKEF